MSTPVPALLRELHRLHKHLRHLKAEIDLGPRVLKVQQQTLDAERQAHADSHEALKKAKLKQKEDEGALKTTEQRLAKLQSDLNMAGSKKEFDTKTHEIEYATKQKGELEDAILAAIMEVEERTADLPNVEKKWADAQAAFAQFQTDAAERLERWLADQKDTQAAVAAAEPQLPPEVKGIYSRLVKSYGADGLAGVVGRSCQQCRTAITEQQRTTILSGGFLTCPSCGRALYLAE
jgi:predicted  nucleic acid-binding Zn-ribbon protein